MGKKSPNLPSYLDDDCDRPACQDTASALQSAFRNMTQKSSISNSSGSSNREQCPPDVAKLGAAGWTILHSMAAWYPEMPNVHQRDQMKHFMFAFAEFYPCTHCAKDFAERLRISPPRVENRVELSMWLCQEHNEVNRKLGKEEFKCSIMNLDRRWRDGGDDNC